MLERALLILPLLSRARASLSKSRREVTWGGRKAGVEIPTRKQQLFNASNLRAPAIIFSDDLRLLTVKGIIAHRIDTVIGPFGFKKFPGLFSSDLLGFWEIRPRWLDVPSAEGNQRIVRSHTQRLQGVRSR